MINVKMNFPPPPLQYSFGVTNSAFANCAVLLEYQWLLRGWCLIIACFPGNYNMAMFKQLCICINYSNCKLSIILSNSWYILCPNTLIICTHRLYIPWTYVDTSHHAVRTIQLYTITVKHNNSLIVNMFQSQKPLSLRNLYTQEGKH